MAKSSLKITADYRNGKGELRHGSVMNISLGGIYVKTEDPLSVGTKTTLGIEIVGEGMMFQAASVVVREDPGKGMALEFEDNGNENIKALLRTIKNFTTMGTPDREAADNRTDPRYNMLSKSKKASRNTITESGNGATVRKDKRRHSRKLLRIEARYQNPDARVLKGIVRNISMSGVYIETSQPLETQARVRLSLDATDLGKVIDVSGRVVRVEPNKGMGVQFDDTENRDIRLLLSTLRKLDQASMLALSRSALGD